MRQTSPSPFLPGESWVNICCPGAFHALHDHQARAPAAQAGVDNVDAYANRRVLSGDNRSPRARLQGALFSGVYYVRAPDSAAGAGALLLRTSVVTREASGSGGEKECGEEGARTWCRRVLMDA